jgi:hypothetical protein
MARSSTDIKITLLIVALGVASCAPRAGVCSTAGVSNVENFIRSIITVFAGLAGLVATGFLVAGGFTYITSSGNPEHLDRGKRTITYSLIGLAITIGAFVISNIVTTLATSAFGG